MSLWVDKYRPQSLNDLSYHSSITNTLRALGDSGDFPHLLVYGPSGAGKKTRIHATISHIFGPLLTRLRIDVKQFLLSSNRKLEFNVMSSPHHMEITPSDMGANDRVVIQDLLKEVALTEQVDFASASKLKHRFKIVVINEADSLSRDAQAALRRTMEKYSANIRLVLVCNSILNIIAPIKLRTLLVRIPSPTEGEIASILEHIAAKESVSILGSAQDRDALFANIARTSNRNLRRALLSFETLAMQNASITAKPPYQILNLDWEVIISNVARQIATSRTVATIAKVRVVMYELLAHCIPPRIILKTLLFDLIAKVGYDNKAISALVEHASVFDERLSLGQKSIFHLEGFVAKAMVAIDDAV